MRRRALLVSVATVGALGAGCSHGSADTTTRHARFSYTCCDPADITAVRHPGGAITLHWIARPAGAAPSGSNPAPVTLSAAMSGPFSDVARLKAAGRSASAIATAVPVHLTDMEGGRPTTTLVIPHDAKPGFYDLTFTVESDGVSTSGASVIRVQRASHPEGSG